METKLVVMRVDVSRKTGEVVLLMENACGFRPVMGWPNKKGMEDFAWNLLGICLQEDKRTTEPNDTNNLRR